MTHQARHIVVVDTETNGLDPELHEAVEVAWFDMATNESASFIPYHNVIEVRARAESEALKITGYEKRIAGRVPKADFDPWDKANPVRRLAQQLDGNTLAGSNPAFESWVLRKLFGRYGYEPSWHHRLLDLAAYAAGRRGRDIERDGLPGLDEVCADLAVPRRGEHTAEGDTWAAVCCFHELRS